MNDFTTPTWHSLRKWAEAQLESARTKNDAVGLSEIETAALRGEIRMWWLSRMSNPAWPFE
jgi:hypothetical protein